MVDAESFDLKHLIEEQNIMSKRVIDNIELSSIKKIAGVDVSYGNSGKLACAVISVLDAKSLELIDYSFHTGEPNFPYIPHFLAFREMPLVQGAFRKLRTVPDIFIYDGNGRLHQRKCGAACSFGLEFDVPTIGCTKSPLKSPQKSGGVRGDLRPIFDESDENDVLGVELVTQTNIKPVYVSVGHKISLAQSIEFILQFSPKYRIPEPIRMAYQLSRQVLASMM